MLKIGLLSKFAKEGCVALPPLLLLLLLLTALNISADAKSATKSFALITLFPLRVSFLLLTGLLVSILSGFGSVTSLFSGLMAFDVLFETLIGVA